MNPVKAGIVKNIAEYPWSSYGHNALGAESSLITEHKLYQELGESAELRVKNYQKIFETLSISKKQEQQITDATVCGEVYGSDAFHLEIKKIISRTTKLAAHGGDRKSEHYKYQAGCPLING